MITTQEELIANTMHDVLRLHVMPDGRVNALEYSADTHYKSAGNNAQFTTALEVTLPAFVPQYVMCNVMCIY